MPDLPLNITDDFYASLSDGELSTLSRIDKWPMEKVCEKLKENHTDENNILDSILEYKQFMFLKFINSDRKLGVYSEGMDNVWHMHILFTEDYHDFCTEIFGKFLHHVPCNIMPRSAENLQEYAEWQENIQKKFKNIKILPRIPPYCQG